MIRYEQGGLNFLRNVVRVNGSVFPKACCVALPNAMFSGLLVLIIWKSWPEKGVADDDGGFSTHFQSAQSVMSNNAVWAGFNFLVGFLVIFRTSQAYNRFWEGVTQTHKMGAEWFDACSSIVAFCKHSRIDAGQILRFQCVLVRLFSMLHAAALGEIEDCGDLDHYSEVHAFNMELIDAEAIGEDALRAIRDSDAKVELIFQWIQQLVVENIRNGVLSIPPPILSRSFQEIAVGMVHFHEAMKLSNVPFPFPYTQICDFLLIIHWLMVPFVVSQWVHKWWWALAFSFIQVFILWTLSFVAVELENPFGRDPNDIDGEEMQLEFNSHLRLLLRPETQRTPSLIFADQDIAELIHKATTAFSEDQSSTFYKSWERMERRKKDSLIDVNMQHITNWDKKPRDGGRMSITAARRFRLGRTGMVSSTLSLQVPEDPSETRQGSCISTISGIRASRGVGGLRGCESTYSSTFVGPVHAPSKDDIRDASLNASVSTTSQKSGSKKHASIKEEESPSSKSELNHGRFAFEDIIIGNGLPKKGLRTADAHQSRGLGRTDSAETNDEASSITGSWEPCGDVDVLAVPESSQDIPDNGNALSQTLIQNSVVEQEGTLLSGDLGACPSHDVHPQCPSAFSVDQRRSPSWL